MINLDQKHTQSMLAVHGWVSVVVGLLLYAVLVTGMVAVFSHEIADWSRPLEGEPPAGLAAGTDRVVRAAAATVDPAYHEDVLVYSQAGDRLGLLFHNLTVDENKQLVEHGVLMTVDPRNGEVLLRQEGDVARLFRDDDINGLSNFLVDLHVSLHVPYPWGYILTGVLGLALLVLGVTGFLVHRNYLKELFSIRRRGTPFRLRDLHAVGGAWVLPFAVVLGFTGSYLSLFGPMGMPVLSNVGFGGDQLAYLEAIAPHAVAEDPTPATTADLDAILADARTRGGGEPDSLAVHDWGRADASVTVYLEPADKRLSGAALTYSGTDGAFLTETPDFGSAPSAGSALASLMGSLHFGEFLGVLSKAVWFCLGLLCAYVVLNGLQLWVEKRRKQPAWRQLVAATAWIAYGLPLALTAVACGYFLALGVNTAPYPVMLTAFLGSAVVAAVVAWTRDDAGRLLFGLTGVLLLALPLLRWLTGGPSWLALSETGLYPVIALDVAILLGGLLLLGAVRRQAARGPEAAPKAATAGPTAPTIDASAR